MEATAGRYGSARCCGRAKRWTDRGVICTSDRDHRHAKGCSVKLPASAATVNAYDTVTRPALAVRATAVDPEGVSSERSRARSAQPSLLRWWSVISGGQLKRTGTPHEPAPTDVYPAISP
jgi:hypothetical protein